MNCRFVHRKLSAYLDSEMSGREMLEMRKHLDQCSHCRQALSQLRALRQMLHEIQVPEIPEGLEGRLLMALDHQKPMRRVARNPYQWVLVGVALGAICVGLVLPRSKTTAPVQNNVATNTGYELAMEQAYTIGADPLQAHPVAVSSNNAPH